MSADAATKYTCDADALNRHISDGLQRQQVPEMLETLGITTLELTTLPVIVQVGCAIGGGALLSTVDLLKATGSRFLPSLLPISASTAPAAARADDVPINATDAPPVRDAPGDVGGVTRVDRSSGNAAACASPPPGLVRLQLHQETVPALRLVLRMLGSHAPGEATVREVAQVIQTVAYLNASIVASGLPAFLDPMRLQLNARQALELLIAAAEQAQSELACCLLDWLAQAPALQLNEEFAEDLWRAMRQVSTRELCMTLALRAPTCSLLRWTLLALCALMCDGACGDGTDPSTPFELLVDSCAAPDSIDPVEEGARLGRDDAVAAHAPLWQCVYGLTGGHVLRLLSAGDWHMRCTCQRGIGRMFALHLDDSCSRAARLVKKATTADSVQTFHDIEGVWVATDRRSASTMRMSSLRLKQWSLRLSLDTGFSVCVTWNYAVPQAPTATTAADAGHLQSLHGTVSGWTVSLPGEFYSGRYSVAVGVCGCEEHAILDLTNWPPACCTAAAFAEVMQRHGPVHIFEPWRGSNVAFKLAVADVGRVCCATGYVLHYAVVLERDRLVLE